MICEDEPMIAMEIAAIVHECGCEAAGPYTSSRAARAALRKQRVDAAILDIELTDGASTLVARMLRESGARMIVISGLRANTPPPEFAGVEWLSKPLDEARLRAFCLGTLAGKRPRPAAGLLRKPEPALPPAL
jgi:DNA-binding response OmpR family regulator